MLARRPFAILTLSALLTFAVVRALSPDARAQNIATSEPTEVCRNQMIEALGQVHDEFHARVFGAAEDTAGTATVKTGGRVTTPVKGILETKGRLSSELVGPLVEAYRAYRCRSLAVCKVIEASVEQSPVGPPAPLTIRILGCDLSTAGQYSVSLACAFGDAINDPTNNVLNQVQRVIGDCDQLVQSSLALERSTLKLAVAYDSGYRSMLQMIGMFDTMLTNLPKRTFEPIRTMVGLLGRLHQIPCFLAQCDYPGQQ